MVEEKVVEVFRHLRNGDPVEIEKNSRSTALPMFGWIVIVYSHHSWAPRRCLWKGDYAKRFPESDSHQCLQQFVEMEVVCFMQTPCLHRNEKKNRLSCACCQW